MKFLFSHKLQVVSFTVLAVAAFIASRFYYDMRSQHVLAEFISSLDDEDRKSVMSALCMYQSSTNSLSAETLAHWPLSEERLDAIKGVQLLLDNKLFALNKSGYAHPIGERTIVQNCELLASHGSTY